MNLCWSDSAAWSISKRWASEGLPWLLEIQYGPIKCTNFSFLRIHTFQHKGELSFFVQEWHKKIEGPCTNPPCTNLPSGTSRFERVCWTKIRFEPLAFTHGVFFKGALQVSQVHVACRTLLLPCLVFAFAPWVFWIQEGLAFAFTKPKQHEPKWFCKLAHFKRLLMGSAPMGSVRRLNFKQKMLRVYMAPFDKMATDFWRSRWCMHDSDILTNPNPKNQT